MESQMFVVTAYMTVKASHFEDFMQRLENHVGLSLKEGRCLSFTVSKSTENPGKLFYYETYRNQSDFKDHIASPRVKTHIESTSPMIDGDIWFEQWETVSDRW